MPAEKETMRPIVRLIAAMTGALVFCAGAARADDALRIRHAYVTLGNPLSPFLFQQQEVLKHYGVSYTVEPIHFKGSTAELVALAAGEVDIVSFSASTFASAIENAKLDDIRIVADGFQDGADGYFSTPYQIRNDSGITAIEDLKGKVLASNVLGGSVDVALRAMMRRHHLEDKKDYTLIEAEFAVMPAMLREKKVDLIGEAPPFAYDPWLTSNAHSLFTMADAVGPTQLIFLAARSSYLDAHRAALGDFFEDLLRGTIWLLDPANREAAIQALARANKLPPERFAFYLYTKQDFYHDKLGRPDLDAVQRDVATQRELGFLKNNIDIGKYADLTFIDAAAARLGLRAREGRPAQAPH